MLDAFKAAEEDKEKIQEAIASLDGAKEISVDAALAADLSELDCIFTMKRNNGQD